MLRRVASGMALMGLVSCAALAGLGDFEDVSDGGGGTGTGAGTGGETSGSCPVAIPAGWEGPFALYDGEGEPPPCTGPWSEGKTGGRDAQPGTCTCDCAIARDATQACESQAWSVQWSDEASCGMPTTVADNLVSDVCQSATTQTVVSAKAERLGPPPTELCAPGEATQGDPSFAQQVNLCSFGGEPDAPALCGRQVPEGYQSRLCVARTGEIPSCPDTFPSRLVFASTIADGSECQCDCNDDGVACDMGLQLFAGLDCTPPIDAALPADGSCVMLVTPLNASHMQIVVSSVTGDCIDAPVVNPQLTVDDYTTVCCEE